MTGHNRSGNFHHSWDHAGMRRLTADACDDGCARNIRACVLCGMHRITIIPPEGYPWHEWHAADGTVYRGEKTPACPAAKASKANKGRAA